MNDLIALHIAIADAQTILSVLRRGQRAYGQHTAGHEVCKAVADRLEEMMLVRGLEAAENKDA